MFGINQARGGSITKDEQVNRGGIETLKKTLEPTRVTNMLKDNKDWLTVLKAETQAENIQIQKIQK